MAKDGEQLMDRGFANLAKAFEVLSQAGQERWFSLTFKMGRERPENGHKQPEELVYAMCLILLKRYSDAHAKLTANADSSIGNYLAEMFKMHGERLNSGHIAGFKATDAKTLLDIARIFAILVKERLCNETLRDQAYRAALVSNRTAGLSSLDIEEEVKQVCGPDAIDKSDTELTTYQLMSPEVSKRNGGHLLTPQLSSGCSSYTLEISSPTASESNMANKPLSLRTPTNSESTTNQDQLRRPTTNIHMNNQLQTAEVNHATNSTQCLDQTGSSQLVTSQNPNIGFSSGPNHANANDRKPPIQANSFCSSEASESDIEETFYAFVILHGDEDADEARRLRDRLELIISAPGATSEDFAQPGRSTLGCIEDAIKNSAFTLLLLTQNFLKSNLSATTADSAIMNSLENHHKLNSVIPLLPRENSLSRDSLPLVLRTKCPLDESNRMFERKASWAITPDKVDNQRKLWLIEQRKKKLQREQKRLKEENDRNAELQGETEKFARLKLESEMRQNNTFYAQSAPTPFNGAMYQQHVSWQPPSSCIHIENAQNVMIGNNSTMNFEHVKNSADE
ncbi:TIR domain-containing adapter molecule 1 [Siphateles boraxobius]|uniref:TIR domain-containing adapter molecule 1 n=1 Tax=Siphateles boraxobius TaxID=180520 RepID=UPI004064552D